MRTKNETIDAFFDKAKEIFLERHKKYGTRGMTTHKAIALAETKLDRIMNGEREDSCLDLANYALIIHLIEQDKWKDEGKEDEERGEPHIICIKGRPNMLNPQHEGDAGGDLVVSEDTTIPPFGHLPVSVPCSFAAKLPEGCWAEIRPRSSTSSKLGVMVHQSCMDNGYTGGWFVVCNSLLQDSVTVKKGTRLAQCVLHPLYPLVTKQVDELPSTPRGVSGFGSTGLN